MVNINPAYRTHELEYALRQSETQALLLLDRFKTSDYVQMFYEVCPEARNSQPGPDLFAEAALPQDCRSYSEGRSSPACTPGTRS